MDKILITKAEGMKAGLKDMTNGSQWVLTGFRNMKRNQMLLNAKMRIISKIQITCSKVKIAQT